MIAVTSHRTYESQTDMPNPTPRCGSLLLLLPIALMTSQKMMDFAQSSGTQAPGFRRAHSKGVCFAGTFAPAPEAASLS